MERLPFWSLEVDKRPRIALIGEHTDSSFGPDAFHRKSPCGLICAPHGPNIVSSDPQPNVFAAPAALAAVARRGVLLGDAPAEQEIPWKEFIKSMAPHVSLFIPIVKGGTP